MPTIPKQIGSQSPSIKLGHGAWKVVNESQSDWDEKIDTADGVQSLSTGIDKEITLLHALPARYAASN